jgi:SWI/SNF-related matrix-associated actin-dependent regulator of chromatin subfamily A-like protein 1
MPILTPYTYQTEGAEFCLKRQGALIGDEAGTGKTIEICLLIKKYNPTYTLIICPAFLCLNWKREIKKWCGEDARVISPDDKSAARELMGITIISYEMSRLMVQWYSNVTFDLIVWDESHYLQNQNSLRSKAARMLKSRKRICLSGTPIQSRPINLWHQLHILNPIRWNSYWDFALKYCNAKKSSNGYWDVSGSSNLDELNTVLRKEIMIRRTKAQVLPELPEKIRQIIEIPCSGYRELLEKEKEFYYAFLKENPPKANKEAKNLTDTFGETYQDELSHMVGNNLYNISQIATIRKKTAMLKVPEIVDHVHNLIHEGQKVVLFAHHHDMIDALRDKFEGCLWADGRLKAEDRDKVCYRFQIDNDKRLLIAGIHALGVGVTLTEADVCVMAELDWLPSIVTQAEDRIHRVGLQHAVIIQHIVLQGSLDLHIANLLVEKQSVISQVM